MQAEARLSEAGLPRGLVALARVLPGLFPPVGGDIDTITRRVLLGLLAALAATGGIAYALLARGEGLLPPMVAGVAIAFGFTLVPWHRYPRDAFGVVGLSAAAWVAWVAALTGGVNSPYLPLNYLAVVICSIPTSRVVGTTLGTIAALMAALPITYQVLGPDLRQEVVLRSLVQILGAVFASWLAEELRRAVTVASTERVQREDAQDATTELRRAQMAREEYLSILAHELRNPLTAINAAARVLARDIAGTSGEATARGIASEAHGAMELVDGLTDVASLESGRMRLALRPTDLSAVLRETTSAAGNGHRVAVRGADEPIFVLGDDRRLAQVIRNLVTNAAKYSPDDAQVQVNIGVSADRRKAIVQVRDLGPGIPPAERSRLFEKFARLSTAGTTRGSGLGLFISRGIVLDHGGELWADWPAGGGSVFSFSVPLTGESRRPPTA